jgi:GTP-dependent phosphoenolpyruvate carboxykinase
MNNTVIIDFDKLGGPVFTGRPRGENLRATLKVEQIDDSDTQVEVKIPDSTYSISSSFILGLFGRSVVKAGSKEAFYKKYHFKSNELFQGIVDSCVTRALQDKTLLGR